MLAIKNCGGISIIQNPDEAEYPDMPLSVLDNVEVDHCISLQNMGDVIAAILKSNPSEKEIPEEILIESQIAERVLVDYGSIERIAEQSIYACPDCGGTLWEINLKKNNKINRYRCHIGHSYTEKDLVVKQGEIFESTMWVALRILEERRNLFLKMEKDHLKKGLSVIAKPFRSKADAIQVHVDKMKEILFASQIIK
jgi:two-component system, chemotaxis family, protein-glutamate methylesterase/glutaminase